MEKDNCKRDIVEWISRLRKPPSINKDKEAEGKEEYLGATQASTKENSSIKKYEEGR